MIFCRCNNLEDGESEWKDKDDELSIYEGIPHLLYPVESYEHEAIELLSKLVEERNSRLSKFEDNQVKDIRSYNKLHPEDHLPQIIVVIDEFADLMKEEWKKTETAIYRLAQSARIVGIHLVIATQRSTEETSSPLRIQGAFVSDNDIKNVVDSVKRQAI